MEDVIDRAASRDYDAWVARGGEAEVERMLDGVWPATVWPERASLPRVALVHAAGINASYLDEIEQRKKPGSVAAIRSPAKALPVPMAPWSPSALARGTAAAAEAG